MAITSKSYKTACIGNLGRGEWMEIELRDASEKSEYACADGELASYAGLGWLKSGEGDGNDGDDSDKDEKERPRVSLSLGLPISVIPPGSRLLALHSPADLYPAFNMIWMTTDGRLMVSPDGKHTPEAGAAEAGRWAESAMGTLTAAKCHGDIVTLLGTERLAWLIKDASTGGYSFRTTLPGKPQCEFSTRPAKLPPYVRVEGDPAQLEVEVGLSSSYGLTAEGWQNWIERGVEAGVDLRLREAVRGAVGDAVAEYLRAVADARLTVGPLRGYASWSGHLAGDVREIGEYRVPKLRISSTKIETDRVRLTLQLDATPLQVSASLTVGADNKLWSDIFPRMEMWLTSSAGWWNSRADDRDFSNIQISGPLTVSHTSNGTTVRSRGFAIECLSAADCAAKLRLKDDFRRCHTVSARTEITGVTDIALYHEGETRQPDYSDHERIQAEGIATHDDGFALWSDNRLLLCDPEFPVVYPYRLRVGDSPIAAAATSTSRRTSTGRGRAPLYIFSADGIREIEARESGDGVVAYLTGRLISRDVVDSAGHVAAESDGVAFVSGRGLMTLSGGKVKRLSGLPKGIGTVSETGSHYRGGVLTVSDGNRLYVYDRIEGRWIDCAVMLTGFAEHGGRLYGMENRGNICELQVTERKPAEAAKIAAMSDSAESASVEDTDASGWRYGTRALKLGDRRGLKSVFRLDFGAECRNWRLESSEDLEHWHEMASGSGRCSGALYLPRRRYWRISAGGDGLPPQLLHLQLR